MEALRPRTAALSAQNRKTRREAAASNDITVIPESFHETIEENAPVCKNNGLYALKFLSS